MLRSMRPYLVALLCVWAGLAVAAWFYSQQHPADRWIVSAALPAFAAEAVFYLGTMFRSTRNWFAERFPIRLQMLLLWLSSLLPYVVFAGATGTLTRNALVLWAVLTGIVAYWFVLTPRRLAYDFGFLILAAAPVVTQVFGRIYIAPDPNIRGLQVLGHLIWFRLATAALLIIREWDPGEFGLWPEAREWRVGILYYAASILPIGIVAVALHDVQFVAPNAGEWQRLVILALGTFFGILWVVALGEELFFRGVIERFLLNAQRSQAAAIVISALLFGAAHLWFHQFPNWRRAVVATVLGLGCGAAYAKTDSVRAPMVTHALVVTTWRVFFKQLS